MLNFLNAEDGYYSLTTRGAVLLIIVMVLLIIAAAMIKDMRENERKKTGALLSTRQLVFSAVSLAVAFALSYAKIIKMPWGGSVTLCSMFFVAIIGYWYGAKIGLICALAYSILQFVQGGGSYILSLPQVAFDYILAFMALGASGFFNRKKNGLLIGYIVAILLRGLFHAIGGYLYWMEYMPDNFPKSLSAVYPIIYNYSYIIIEGIITVIVIMLPPVKKAIAEITQMARE